MSIRISTTGWGTWRCPLVVERADEREEISSGGFGSLVGPLPGLLHCRQDSVFHEIRPTRGGKLSSKTQHLLGRDGCNSIVSLACEQAISAAMTIVSPRAPSIRTKGRVAQASEREGLEGAPIVHTQCFKKCGIPLPPLYYNNPAPFPPGVL